MITVKIIEGVEMRRTRHGAMVSEIHISRSFSIASLAGRELSPAAASFTGILRERCGECMTTA